MRVAAAKGLAALPARRVQCGPLGDRPLPAGWQEMDAIFLQSGETPRPQGQGQLQRHLRLKNIENRLIGRRNMAGIGSSVSRFVV